MHPGTAVLAVGTVRNMDASDGQVRSPPCVLLLMLNACMLPGFVFCFDFLFVCLLDCFFFRQSVGYFFHTVKESRGRLQTRMQVSALKELLS